MQKRLNNSYRNLTKPLRNTYTKYSEFANKEKKIAIISASITKPIDIKEFNDLIKNGKAVKRAFGGATASQLN